MHHPHDTRVASDAQRFGLRLGIDIRPPESASWERLPIRRYSIALALILAVPIVVVAPRAHAAASSPWLDRDRDRILDALETRLDAGPPEVPLRTIVLLDRVRVADALPRLTAIAGPFAVTRTYGAALDGFAAPLLPWQITALAGSPLVLQIEADAPTRGDLATAATNVRASLARSAFGVTGDGDGLSTYTPDDAVIAVVDTGIDPRHLDLDGGKVLGWKDFVADVPVPYDDNGHGTHIAGIAAGDGDASGGARVGVAPGAALVGVKVLTGANVGWSSDTLAGIDWIVANREVYGIDVLSISISSSGAGDGTSASARAVDAAYAAGIVVAASAGNGGPAEGTISTPADAKGAIAVAAAADPGEGGWYLAPTSARGYTLDGRVKPDIVAPGVGIESAAANTLAGHVRMSGTSMATPFVAGAAALLLAKDPTLSPAAVRHALLRGATPVSSHLAEIDWGAGMLDVAASVGLLGPGADRPPALPSPAHFEGRARQSEPPSRFPVVANGGPLAATLIVQNYREPELGQVNGLPEVTLRMYDARGALVSDDLGARRQKVVCLGCATADATVVPKLPSGAVAGRVYTVEIEATHGDADFVLDVSGTSTVPGSGGSGAGGGVAEFTLSSIDLAVRIEDGGSATPDARVLLDGSLTDGTRFFRYGYTDAGGSLRVAVPPSAQSVVVREVLKPDWQWDGYRPVATL